MPTSGQARRSVVVNRRPTDYALGAIQIGWRHSKLKRLQGHQEYPSVSLLAPTHRTAPANQRDRIVVKNLLDEGIARLEGEFAKREVAPVVKNLTKLVDKVDWDHALDGLALFASKGIAQAVQLPFRVKARFVVDAVDELIEKTLADGGEVFFYDDGALDLHQRIAAVLRY